MHCNYDIAMPELLHYCTLFGFETKKASFATKPHSAVVFSELGLQKYEVRCDQECLITGCSIASNHVSPKFC